MPGCIKDKPGYRTKFTNAGNSIHKSHAETHKTIKEAQLLTI